ncbi:FlxA-like family protein [Paenibacillus sp. MMS20-IR301]|uniref:FlxA-like family protein n=1 Tax=Paenibacillus sp. MMS20-IR301 TaxID=2895946 RepID=UPI0028E2D87C|nr:FlxA-like family protein [Paenibacillus sp. MMS20-IR301]WNS44364.1 FlxA-like family protein [Paenibacillus sp. MMS20-IR301]
MSSISSTSSQFISPISSASHQFKTNSRDKEIQGLLDQKSRLNEQIETVRSNENMDKKLKQERVQSLKSSIQEIDAQIAQIRAEVMQEKIENSKIEQKEAPKKQANAVPTTDISAESMGALIKNSTTYDQLGKLVQLGKRLEREINPIQSEIKTERDRLAFNPTNDVGRPMMLENAERVVLQGKREQILDIKSTVRGIDSKIGDLVSELNESSETSVKTKNVPGSLSPAEEKTGEIHKSSKNKDQSGSGETAATENTSASASGSPSASASGSPSASPSIDILV